jgi:hypothetical protein
MPELPGHDRRKERRARRRGRRLVRDGDEYDILEEDRDEIELEQVERRPEPPVDIQGEPWGWTKPGDRPKGWPGPSGNRDDPGPYDGSWDPPEGGNDGAH